MFIEDGKIEAVRKALFRARYEFDTTHGLLVTDIPNQDTTWRIDFSDAINIIDEAIAFWDTLDSKDTSYCS